MLRRQDIDNCVLAAVRGIIRSGAPWPGVQWIAARIGHSQSTVTRSLHRMRRNSQIDFSGNTHGLRDLCICDERFCRMSDARRIAARAVFNLLPDSFINRGSSA